MGEKRGRNIVSFALSSSSSLSSHHFLFPACPCLLSDSCALCLHLPLSHPLPLPRLLPLDPICLITTVTCTHMAETQALPRALPKNSPLLLSPSLASFRIHAAGERPRREAVRIYKSGGCPPKIQETPAPLTYQSQFLPHASNNHSRSSRQPVGMNRRMDMTWECHSQTQSGDGKKGGETCAGHRESMMMKMPVTTSDKRGTEERERIVAMMRMMMMRRMGRKTEYFAIPRKKKD